MFNNNRYKKCMIVPLLFFTCSLHTAFAHEGHSHEAVITLGKKTVVHLQSILSTYQEVYHHLVKKDLDGITDLAQKLSDAAWQAAQTESDDAGRHMMQRVLAGAEALKKTKSVQDAQKAFASMSDALLPFFTSWPNQLKQNELKLCRCKHDGRCWLQPQNCASACPYSTDRTKICSDVEEAK